MHWSQKENSILKLKTALYELHEELESCSSYDSEYIKEIEFAIYSCKKRLEFLINNKK